jgi:hypothetical protein
MSQVMNEELLAKSVATADTLASAGKLNPQQAEKFLDYVIQETVWKDNARIVKVKAEQYEIDKIGVGKRNALPAAEASDPRVRRGVTTSKITMQPREIMLPFEIGDTFKEINIEGDSVEDHIIKMMAKALANDLEELCINGDALGPAVLESDLLDQGSATQYVKDSYLGMFDGWLRAADSGNLYDAAGANIGASVWSGMIRALPTKFRADRAKLRFIVSSDMDQLWRERLATRATGVGDAAIADGKATNAFGIPLVAVPRLPLQPKCVQHVTLNGTTAVALRYTNVSQVVVTPITLAGIPTTPYVASTDYTLDATAGTIARIAGQAISDGQVVKVTYLSNPQIILSHMENFILAIGREIRIEKDRDIYRRVNQYAVTCKVATAVEEATAIAKGKNLGTGI